jgi:hypothetical protein
MIPGMSTAIALDLEFARFAAPDLNIMHGFLSDFGMRDVADLGDGILRMRGTGDVPVVHETVQGEPGFACIGLRVRDKGDLAALADAEGCEITPARGPGGGHMVTLRDPDGFVVEAIAGRKRVAATPHGSRPPWNVAARHEREGVAKRVERGPASVAGVRPKRLNIAAEVSHHASFPRPVAICARPRGSGKP